jgi:3,4-dihydroxy-2-butanone 4-phosphate synthase
MTVLTYKNQEENTENKFSDIKDAIAAFAKGEFLLVSDDEDRENEGDLIIAAEHTTADAVNFMVTKGRGLVCIAISEEIAKQKGLRPMVEINGDHLGTAFTASVDAVPALGITTGISTAERAKTIQVLINGNYAPNSLTSPGHMFPLIAKPQGIRERVGHTEAGVDLAKLAGLAPAATIVEVIKEDGTMARRDDLLEFSNEYNIRYITIADLREYVLYLDECETYAKAS